MLMLGLLDALLRGGGGWTASALRGWRLRCLWPSNIDAVGQSQSGRKSANRHGLLGIVTLGALEIVRHLQAGPPETALDVEALVVLAAVEDGLVTPRLPGDEVEGLDDAQTQLLALLVLGDGDVLDVANGAEIVDAEVRDGPPLVRLCHYGWMDTGKQAMQRRGGILTTCAPPAARRCRRSWAGWRWCPR